MPLLLGLGLLLSGGAIAIASNAADNVTEKTTAPIGGGVSKPLSLTNIALIGGLIYIIVKKGKIL